MLCAQHPLSLRRTTNTTLNNQIKKALENVTKETREGYYAGKVPSRFVIALSKLTLWEQDHLKYMASPNDPNRSIACALVDDNDNVITPAEDRRALLQAVTDLFLEDQLSFRLTGRIESLGKE